MIWGIFTSLLIIEVAVVWIAMDISSIRKLLGEIKRLLEEGAGND